MCILNCMACASSRVWHVHGMYAHRYAKRERARRAAAAAAAAARPASGSDEDTRAFARKVMARVPLLASLSDEELDGLVREARVASYDAGDTLINEGEIGRRFFVVVDGECDVFESSKGLSSESRMPGFSPDAMRTAYGQRTNVLGPGSYFGERGLATNEPRVATVLAATPVTALTVERSSLTSVDRSFDDSTKLSALVASSENFLWGYELKQPPVDDDVIQEAASSRPPPLATLDEAGGGDALVANNPKALRLTLMQRLRLVRSVVRAFDQAAKRSPKWGNPEEKAYRAGLVAQLTASEVDEFMQTFDIIDKDGDGRISPSDLASLMTAVGREPDEGEILAMINKANPEVEGNDDITAPDFLALMAQAEYSAMFLEAFKLLDPNGYGWVESEQLWKMMSTLVPPDENTLLGNKVDELIETFGVSDGHIDYQAFVKIMIEGTGDAAPRPAA